MIIVSVMTDQPEYGENIGMPEVDGAYSKFFDAEGAHDFQNTVGVFGWDQAWDEEDPEREWIEDLESIRMVPCPCLCGIWVAAFEIDCEAAK